MIFLAHQGEDCHPLTVGGGCLKVLRFAAMDFTGLMTFYCRGIGVSVVKNAKLY